jgi:hypothetical protein
MSTVYIWNPDLPTGYGVFDEEEIIDEELDENEYNEKL